MWFSADGAGEAVAVAVLTCVIRRTQPPRAQELTAEARPAAAAPGRSGLGGRSGKWIQAHPPLDAMVAYTLLHYTPGCAGVWKHKNSKINST